MPVNIEAYKRIKAATDAKKATLVAVSKTKPAEDILELYELGQRDFGENYVQELVDKYATLPKDIRWHFIGHLQSNKVKYIAPFVYLIHGTDSEKLLAEINKQAAKNNRIIDCLLQVHIAEEETKFGFDETELKELITKLNEQHLYENAAVRGLMGMASFTNDKEKVHNEFKQLSQLYKATALPSSVFNLLSMGMSGDYETALDEGSNMIRIGSLLFGERNYTAK
jgi:PLP dependent protein